MQSCVLQNVSDSEVLKLPRWPRFDIACYLICLACHNPRVTLSQLRRQYELLLPLTDKTLSISGCRTCPGHSFAAAAGELFEVVAALPAAGAASGSMPAKQKVERSYAIQN